MDSTKSLWATVMQQQAAKDHRTAQNETTQYKTSCVKSWLEYRSGVCSLRSSQVFSETTNSSTLSSDLCTPSCLMGLFITVFGVWPEAETEDLCFGVPLKKRIIEADKEREGSLISVDYPASPPCGHAADPAWNDSIRAGWFSACSEHNRFGTPRALLCLDCFSWPTVSRCYPDSSGCVDLCPALEVFY